MSHRDGFFTDKSNVPYSTLDGSPKVKETNLEKKAKPLGSAGDCYFKLTDEWSSDHKKKAAVKVLPPSESEVKKMQEQLALSMARSSQIDILKEKIAQLQKLHKEYINGLEIYKKTAHMQYAEIEKNIVFQQGLMPTIRDTLKDRHAALLSFPADNPNLKYLRGETKDGRIVMISYSPRQEALCAFATGVADAWIALDKYKERTKESISFWENILSEASAKANNNFRPGK